MALRENCDSALSMRSEEISSSHLFWFYLFSFRSAFSAVSSVSSLSSLSSLSFVSFFYLSSSLLFSSLRFSSLLSLLFPLPSLLSLDPGQCHILRQSSTDSHAPIEDTLSQCLYHVSI